MEKRVSFERIIALYLPWLLSTLFQADALLSYFIAWGGSFFIFYITLSGWVRPLPKDLSVGEQLMRPIFLVQIIFAGYTCCTSVFYLLNVLGYDNFNGGSTFIIIDASKLALTAECQRYYCLGHAAFVTGIVVFMSYPVKRQVKIETNSLANLLLYAAAISLPLSIVFLKVPGLSQFSNQFSSLSFVAGTLALAFAIPQKKIWNTVMSLALYFSNFYTALTSGFKEPIIISVLILGIFLYPTYKKLVLAIFAPALLVLFFLLPTYAKIFRQNAWSDQVGVDDASQLALDAALNPGEDVDDTNWGFLVYRLSEIDMFTTFISSTPEKIDFYRYNLLEQSLLAIIPRVFWPDKPSTEDLVMERVYDAGVINRGSNVSAKPAFIVDAYLSFGQFGVLVFLLAYGAAAQLISLKAEKLFGGYLLGTALIFSGLFQILWRGLSLEFIINSVFWSYISMLMIAWVLRQKKIILPV